MDSGMNLWSEAVQINLFGMDLYAFGLYCAIGALSSALVLGVLGWGMNVQKGAAPLIFILSFVSGLVVSRLCFCLMDRSLGRMFPLSAWLRITEGGWSLAGLIGGAMLGAFLSSRALKEAPAKVFDMVSCALPLTLAAVKFGESKLTDFDISRKLPDGIVLPAFLTVKDPVYTDVTYLATHRLGMLVYLTIFLFLTFSLLRKGRREGDSCVSFLLLCGACGILLESLRYDHFLELSFVRLEQVVYALILALGVIAAVRRAGTGRQALKGCAVAFLILAIGACIGVEFALDRTGLSHGLLYAGMTVALILPVAFSMALMGTKGQKRA